MWVTKLLISPLKKRIQILVFLFNLGQAMQAYSVPCWWVGWWLWRVGYISQDTYLLYVSFCSFAVFPRNYSVFAKGTSLPQLCKSSNSVQTLIIRVPTIFLSVVLDFQHFTPTPSVCNNIEKGMQRNL